MLLGLDRAQDTFDDHKAGRHRDSSVVEVDVQRSLWSFSEGEARHNLQHRAALTSLINFVWYLEGWSDDQRDLKRKELRHVLDAAVCSHYGAVFYYQGLHDIASVLLFVMGERAACQTLSHLSCCQLRDCTRYVSWPVHVLSHLLFHTALLYCTARSTSDAVLELLGLLMPILEEVIEVA